MSKLNEVGLSDFRIFETDEFAKQFKKLSSRDGNFLRRKLNSYVYPQIRTDPFWGTNIKKHQDYSPATWRYRIGRFRLFYVVDQESKTISILTIDDRKDAYKRPGEWITRQ